MRARIRVAAMDRDFAEITSAVLDAYGYSEAQLARQLNVSQPTVHRIKKGYIRTLSYQVGAQLIDLYERRPQPLDAA